MIMPFDQNDQTRAIAAFRSKASFDSYSMACFLEGGPDRLQEKRDAWDRVETALDCKDTWRLPSIYGEQTRSEQFDEGLKAGRVMFEDGMKYGHKLFDEMTWKYQMGNALPFGKSNIQRISLQLLTYAHRYNHSNFSACSQIPWIGRTI